MKLLTGDFRQLVAEIRQSLLKWNTLAELTMYPQYLVDVWQCIRIIHCCLEMFKRPMLENFTVMPNQKMVEREFFSTFLQSTPVIARNVKSATAIRALLNTCRIILF